MISNVSEKKMHFIRWVLVIGWSILILSLFINDPFTFHLTDPTIDGWNPLQDQLLLKANDPATCVRVQGECITQLPYYPGARIFWGMIVPAGIMIVLVLGHEFWRRICPLYFFSQIPRALGLKPKLKIENNNWLRTNHFYLQFAYFFIGLNSRILFINSARPVLGLFLGGSILLAITTVFLYGGRSWCHYVCPFGMVQMVFTGPRGLLGSQAQFAPPKSITQSMCRKVDNKTGNEKSACITCKSPCLDIDSENYYWEHLHKPGRKFVQYGYLGMVLGYFFYYYFYSGNFKYYFSGAWTHEQDQLANVLKPGFYFGGNAIPIPKLVASPLTLAFFVGITFLICHTFEKAFYSYLRRRNPDINRDLALHRVFSICTFISFNFFFIYGGRPEILRLPILVQLIFNALVVLVSSFWLYQTWGHTKEQYKKESIVHKLRRQLDKLSKKQNIDFSAFLNNRSLEDLKPSELELLLNVLPNVLPEVTAADRKEVYKGLLKEALEEGRFRPPSISKEELKELREKLKLNDGDHDGVFSELIAENPLLGDPDRTVIKHNEEATIIRIPTPSEDDEDVTRIARRPPQRFNEDDATRFTPRNQRPDEDAPTRFVRPNQIPEDDATRITPRNQTSDEDATRFTPRNQTPDEDAPTRFIPRTPRPDEDGDTNHPPDR